MFGYLLYDVLFFGLPLALLLFFGYSLFLFIDAKRKNKAAPGSVSDSDVKKRKIMLIVASAICGVLLAVVIGFIIMMFMAVAYM